MPVPFPAEGDVLLTRPDAMEARIIAGGVAGAVAPGGRLTPLQHALIEALTESMTGFVVPAGQVPRLGPVELAHGLARRNAGFRGRMVQFMMLCELVLVPLPEAVAERVERYAEELGLNCDFLRVARRFARGSLGLALIDFDRSGYTQGWTPEQSAHLHTSSALDEAWEMRCDDPALAAKWAALADCPDGSLGRAVSRFYEARGFSYPGLPESAPPLLAQHDWVHVLAEYGSTVESEIETFGFICRANDDPRAFSLLAMVISLFETGYYVGRGAGLFEADLGHLSQNGMPARLADAMRRGAECANARGQGIDFLTIDWFGHADRPTEEVRAEFGMLPKSERALEAGSVTPWEPGGISPYQFAHGRSVAMAAGRAYDSYGAAPPDDGAANGVDTGG